MKVMTELTPLNVNCINYDKNICINIDIDNDNNFKYKIKYIWYKLYGYFWKFIFFLLILVIINTILRSMLRTTPNLIFASSINKDYSNNNDNNDILLQNKILPNIIWIDTDYILKNEDVENDKLYLKNKLIEQGTLFENVLNDEINNFNELISTNDYKIYNFDYKDLFFKDFQTIFENDDIEKRLFLYLSLKKQKSLIQFDQNIEEILKYLKLKRNINIWQNYLFILHSNGLLLLSGPRNPNKFRGIKSLDPFNLFITNFMYNNNSNSNNNNNTSKRNTNKYIYVYVYVCM